MPKTKKPALRRKTSAGKQSAPQIQNIFQKIYAFFETRPVLGYVALTIALMGGIAALEGVSQYFKASVLEAQVAPFDGTVFPFEKIPNWVQTGGSNDRLYSSYSGNELIKLMPYDAAQLSSNDTNNMTRNAQITYAVAYMAAYDDSHTEGAGSHLALDIRAPKGTPVVAVANGIIEKATLSNGGFGNHVVLKVPDAPLVAGGTDTLYVGYNHLNTVKVSVGDIVQKGDPIGTIGDSGTATTPHLHFQIDTSSAPWHPWWPFSSAEASAAGLSFFSAVNAGLGQQQAYQNTLNPMIWVQKFQSYTASSQNTTTNSGSGSSGSNITNTSAQLSAFGLDISSTQVTAGDEVTFTITALDSDEDTLADFDEEFEFTCSDRNIEIPRIRFRNGIAEFALITVNPGRIKCSIFSNTIDESVRITVEEDISGSLHSSPEINENSAQFGEFVLYTDETAILLENSAQITVTAVDTDQEVLSDFILQTAIDVTSKKGKVSPKTLTASSFDNGVATLEFTATEAGTASINVGDFGDIEIEVIGEFTPVYAFEVASAGRFIPGVPLEITIKTIDESEVLTPRSFRGTVRMLFEEGQGTFEPAELSAQDFTNGVATVQMTGISGPIKVKAHAGTLVGFSDRINENKSQIFTDISTSYKYADEIEYLKKAGVIGGNPDGSFAPDDVLNRAAAAKVILEALEIAIRSGNPEFTDIAQQEWYKDYVYTGVAEKILNGYPDKTFRGVNNVNRAEFFKVLLEAGNAPLRASVTSSPCSDVNVDDWFATYMEFAVENELLDFSSSKCSPSAPMRREEMAVALARFMQDFL